MTKRMLVDALHAEEMRVVVADETQIFEFDFVTAAKKQIKGNIYLAKITRVEPSLQAAFVEYGGGKQGFLPFAEIHPDYYQIPVEDRKRLIEEAQREADQAEGEFEDSAERTSGGASADQPQSLEHAEQISQQDGRPEPESDPENAEAQPTETAFAAPFPIFAAAEEAADTEIISDEMDEHSKSKIMAALAGRGQTVQSEETATEFTIEPLELNEDLIIEQPAEAGTTETVRGEEGFETLSNEEDVSARPKRNQFSKRYKIQEVIRRGQVVLVQVNKEERGNKGVSLTTYLSLAGRYCVLMPNSPKDGGISRKIASNDDRRRLKEVLSELQLSQGMSVIIRTAGLDRSRTEIKRDFDYLVKLWNRIREDTLASTAPALVYQESDLIKRCIRDQYTSDIDELVIAGDEAYKSAKDFMKMLLPSHAARIKNYKDATPIFYAYNVEDQLLSMHDPVVKLKSGGYIVLNPTEALISIDVNSGRATGERNIEETAYKTNMEAANEIARQLRLRDLAGLIVIDFIDMMESRNRRAIERSLKDALKVDRAKIQLGRISPFGLLEMSRQRLRPGISESSTIICPHCTGRGHIRSQESLSLQIMRVLEKDASNGSWGILKLVVPEAVALHLLNAKRASLNQVEEQHGVQLQVMIDHSLSITDYKIEKQRRNAGDRNEPRKRGRETPEHVVSTDTVQIDDLPEDFEETELSRRRVDPEGSPVRPARSRRSRGGRGRGRDRDERPARDETAATDSVNADSADTGIEASDPAEADANRPPRRPRGERGGRGRRRWRDKDGNETTASSENGAANPEAEPVPTSWKGGASEVIGAIEVPPPLPAFTRQPVKNDAAAQQLETGNSVTQSPLASTPRDPNTAAKRGWWQKMIQLDD